MFNVRLHCYYCQYKRTTFSQSITKIYVYIYIYIFSKQPP